jgi:hypothetical protein
MANSEIRDIVRRAGILTENWEDDEDEADAKSDEEYRRAQVMAELFNKAGVAVGTISADIDEKRGLIEFLVSVDDSRMNLGTMARLSEAGAVYPETEIWASREGKLYLETVMPLNRRR